MPLVLLATVLWPSVFLLRAVAPHAFFVLRHTVKQLLKTWEYDVDFVASA